MRFFVALLALAVIASAVTVVQVTQEHRVRVMELDRLERQRVELEADYGRLQLEEGALAAHARVERIARERLGMVRPDEENVEVVLR
ncbi:MAG: cell division protein FtsL [Halothiobacillaceae bacterium]